MAVDPLEDDIEERFIQDWACRVRVPTLTLSAAFATSPPMRVADGGRDRRCRDWNAADGSLRLGTRDRRRD
jgi:hypothetical protein